MPETMTKEYQVKLFYGWEETENGTFHAFEAVDPNVEHDAEKISEELAEQLDRKVDDIAFDYNSMYVSLPDTLIQRIQEDAIREHETKKGEN